jgi:hypothetical protein
MRKVLMGKYGIPLRGEKKQGRNRAQRASHKTMANQLAFHKPTFKAIDGKLYSVNELNQNGRFPWQGSYFDGTITPSNGIDLGGLQLLPVISSWELTTEIKFPTPPGSNNYITSSPNTSIGISEYNGTYTIELHTALDTIFYNAFTLATPFWHILKLVSDSTNIYTYLDGELLGSYYFTSPFDYTLILEGFNGYCRQFKIARI